jgi:phosphate/sulfate permease
VLLLLLLLQIIISWFLSPIAAALVCLLIFLIIRTFVLRRPNSTKIAFWVLPVLIIVTIWVVSFLALALCRCIVVLYGGHVLHSYILQLCKSWWLTAQPRANSHPYH